MCAICFLIVQPEILAVIKFGVFAPNNVFNTIGDLNLVVW